MELDKKIKGIKKKRKDTSQHLEKKPAIPHDKFDKNYYKQPVMTEPDGEPLFYRIDRQDEITKEVREKLKRNELYVWEPKRNVVFDQDSKADTNFSSINEEVV